jgi:hypothetical protein
MTRNTLKTSALAVAGLALASTLAYGGSKAVSRIGQVTVYDPIEVTTVYREGVSSVDSTSSGSWSAVAELAVGNYQTVGVSALTNAEADTLTIQCARFYENGATDIVVSRSETDLTSADVVGEAAAGTYYYRETVFDTGGASYVKILVTAMGSNTNDVDLWARTY